jgi:hypothetical protein
MVHLLLLREQRLAERRDRGGSEQQIRGRERRRRMLWKR